MNAPLPTYRRPRRLPRFSQAEIARVLRAVKQAGGECVVRLDPDGGVTIGGTAWQHGPSVDKLPPVRDFTL
jgi:hypothetical protein